MSRASMAMESAFANLFVQGADPHDESGLDGQGLAARGPRRRPPHVLPLHRKPGHGHPTSGSSSSVSSLTPVRTGRGRDFRCHVRHPGEPVVPVEAVHVVVGFVQAAVQVVQFGSTGQRLHCIAGGQRVWDPGCRRRRGPGRCGRYCRVSVPKTSTFPQPSLLAVWRKRAVLPENVSIAGACVMVPQVSSSRGTALTKESDGNVTRPVSFTVPVTAWSALVSSKIEIEPVILCPGLHHGDLHGSAQIHHQRAPCGRGGDRQRSTIGSRNIRNLRLR